MGNWAEIHGSCIFSGRKRHLGRREHFVIKMARYAAVPGQLGDSRHDQRGIRTHRASMGGCIGSSPRTDGGGAIGIGPAQAPFHGTGLFRLLVAIHPPMQWSTPLGSFQKCAKGTMVALYKPLDLTLAIEAFVLAFPIEYAAGTCRSASTGVGSGHHSSTFEYAASTAKQAECSAATGKVCIRTGCCRCG